MPTYPKPQAGQAKSREEGGRAAPAGWWVHPETGNRAITLEDPLFGNAQSQAFLQAGFVFERDANPDEVQTLPQLALEQNHADRENFKGLSARMSALEGVADENAALKRRIAELEAQGNSNDPATQSGNDAKKAAFNRVDADMQLNPGDDTTPGGDETSEEDENSGDDTPEKPLNKQNATELKATAEREGVDVSGADTNKKLVAAIQKARDAKESEK